MAGQPADEEEEKPLDPAVEKVRQRLVRFMGINLGLLFVALMAVVAAIVYKRGTASEAPPVASLTPPSDGGLVEGKIPLPPGSSVVSQSLSGDRVSLQVEEQGGSRSLYIFDVAAGRMVARFAIAVGN